MIEGEFKIKTKNDGKEKRQSWEATAELQDGWPDAHFRFSATGYGEKERDAVYELKNALMNMMGTIKEEMKNV